MKSVASRIPRQTASPSAVAPACSHDARQTLPRFTLPATGVLVLERHYSPTFKMSPLPHDFLEFAYVLGGRGEIVVDQKRLFFRPGDLLFIPPGVTEQLVVDAAHPPSFILLFVAPRLGHRLAPNTPRWSRPNLRRNSPICREFARTARYLLYEQTMRRPGFENVIEGNMLQLLALYYRRVILQQDEKHLAVVDSAACYPRVRAFVEELDRNFFGALSINSAATALQMSRRRFTLCFREITGTSFGDYLQSLRVAHARFLLRETSRTILAIGFECGFDSATTFYRTFKKLEGLSPTEWRTRHFAQGAWGGGSPGQTDPLSRRMPVTAALGA